MGEKYYPIEKKWAILIGINRYSDRAFRSLRYAVSDVVAVYEILCERSYNKEHIRLLTSKSTSLNLKPTRNNILREVRRVSQGAGKHDSILIYFSGHGLEEDGQSYLVPADASDEILMDTAIPLEKVKETLLQSEARFKILVVDSCHSGIRFGTKGENAMTKGFFKSLKAEAEGWAVLASCQQGEVSWEWKEHEHSVFTQYLIEALNGKADSDNDGIISISEAGNYVMRKVRNWAQQNNKKQNPTLSINISGGVDIELVRLPEKEVREEPIVGELCLFDQIKKTHGRFAIFQLVPSKLKSYSDIKEDVDSLLEIQLVPFESRVNVPPYHSHLSNMRYHLRFYFPKRPGKDHKYEYLFIMFNGLAEATPAIYDDLGLEFAKNGIPSVLFPLTNHYFRRLDFRCDTNDIFAATTREESVLTSQGIIKEIATEPERIIDGYIQMMSDMDLFWNSRSDPVVSPDFHRFYNTYFEKNTKLCLLGYSLGGLVILALLLKDPDRYHSIYLLESGANFGDINAGMLFVRNEALVKLIWRRYVLDPVTQGLKKIEDVGDCLVFKNDRKEMHDAWKQVVERVNSGESISEMEKEDPFFFQRFVRTPEESAVIWDGLVLHINRGFASTEMLREEKDIFERIVLGNFKTLYKEDLSKLCNKILIFLGGIDAVFTAGAIQSFAPEKTGLAIMQVPGLGHWLKFSSRTQWVIWKEFITKTIINFSEIGPLGNSNTK